MGPTGTPVIQEQLEQEQQQENEPEQEQQLVHPQQDVKMKGKMHSDFPGISRVELKIEMPSSSYSASEPSSSAEKIQVNLPSGDLLGYREEFLRIGVPLYEASVKGDWEKARDIFNLNSELLRCAITGNYDTALHVAVSAKSTKLVENFVEQLTNLMTPGDLQIQNRNANTAFCLAVAGGNVSIAKILVRKNREIVNICGNQGLPPLYIASLFGKYEMVKYLYGISDIMRGKCWNPENRGWVFQKCIEADLFDVALKMVRDRPELSYTRDVLQILARKTDSFKAKKPHLIWRVISKIFAVINVNIGHVEEESQAMQLLRIVWGNIVQCRKTTVDAIIRGPADDEPAKVDDIIKGPPDKAPESETRKKYSSRAVFIAAKMGNTKFMVELIRKYPDLIWKLNSKKQSIFHVAVLYRQEGIYNLLYEIGSIDMLTSLKDEDDNNMLHLAWMKAMNTRLQGISSVALQMQRELLWYKVLLSVHDSEKLAVCI